MAGRAGANQIAFALENLEDRSVPAVMGGAIATLATRVALMQAEQPVVAVCVRADQVVAREAESAIVRSVRPGRDTVVDGAKSLGSLTRENLNRLGERPVEFNTAETLVARDQAFEMLTEVSTAARARVAEVDLAMFETNAVSASSDRLATMVEAASLSNEIDAVADSLVDLKLELASDNQMIFEKFDFLNKQQDAVKARITRMVDADMEEASAQLQALQVQQHLGTQALSIAKSTPQTVLSLFR